MRRADDEGGDEGVGERRQLGRRRVHVEHERRRSREGLAVELAYVKQATAPPTDGDGSTAGSREQSSLVWMLAAVDPLASRTSVSRSGAAMGAKQSAR